MRKQYSLTHKTIKKQEKLKPKIIVVHFPDPLLNIFLVKRKFKSRDLTMPKKQNKV